MVTARDLPTYDLVSIDLSTGLVHVLTRRWHRPQAAAILYDLRLRATEGYLYHKIKAETYAEGDEWQGER